MQKKLHKESSRPLSGRNHPSLLMVRLDRAASAPRLLPIIFENSRPEEAPAGKVLVPWSLTMSFSDWVAAQDSAISPPLTHAQSVAVAQRNFESRLVRSACDAEHMLVRRAVRESGASGGTSGTNSAHTTTADDKQKWRQWLRGDENESQQQRRDEAADSASSAPAAVSQRATAHVSRPPQQPPLSTEAASADQALAAAKWDHLHKGNRQRAKVNLLKTSVAGSVGESFKFSYRDALNEVRRHRYVAPNLPVAAPSTVRTRKARAFDVYKSIFRPRMNTADSRDLFESDVPMLHRRLMDEWSRACKMGALAHIARYDDDGASGTSTEAEEVAEVLRKHERLIHSLFSHFAAYVPSLDLLTLSAWEMLVKECGLVTKKSKTCTWQHFEAVRATGRASHPIPRTLSLAPYTPRTSSLAPHPSHLISRILSLYPFDSSPVPHPAPPRSSSPSPSAIPSAASLPPPLRPQDLHGG